MLLRVKLRCRVRKSPPLTPSPPTVCLTSWNVGACELTLYTGCCNADRGVYYYTTYDNSQITAVDMHHADLNGCEPVSYPLVTELRLYQQN